MNWTEATTLLNAAQRVIIVTHLSPDGDAIGTLLGLGHALREQGKTVTVAVDDGVPANLQFLPGSDAVLPNLKDVQADLVIVVDCGDEARAGKVGKAARMLAVPMINLDHHWSNPGFADVNLIDSSWTSASEGVLDWLDAMNMPISRDTAQCLLCGLVTDTLGFRTDSTKADTLGKAQRLVESGGNLSFIIQHTLARMATSTLKLWAQVLPTVKIEDHVVWVTISIEARKAAGLNGKGSGDSKDGGLSSVLVQADDAYISCVMHERENDQVELSFRGVPGFDTSTVAVAIGGGGHKLASGATVKGTLAEVEARVIPMLKAAVLAGSPISA
ncbi:MAG: DHH family phosphoesterase [Chloroflexota bacterium]